MRRSEQRRRKERAKEVANKEPERRKENREGRKTLGGGVWEAQGVFCFFKMEEDSEAKMPAAPRKQKKSKE